MSTFRQRAAADMEVANSSQLGMAGSIESVGLNGSSQALSREGNGFLDKTRLHQGNRPTLTPLRCQAAEWQRARVTGSLRHPFQRSEEVEGLTECYQLYGTSMGAASNYHGKIASANSACIPAGQEHDNTAAPHEFRSSKQWKLPSDGVNTNQNMLSKLTLRRMPHLDERDLRHVSRLARSVSDPGTSISLLVDVAKFGLPRVPVEQVREERQSSATILAASRANDLAAGPSSLHSWQQQMQRRPLASLVQQLQTIAVADA
eukprot:TRINITY_DN27124_c0_g1_i1.p1 TRINITY_DN27124_c0_g1~~TRINITY_DN27124_c0_g1_i1.p1  ORF type:complete len:261 (+),score=38.06 TRINITY_DN27124_c0_g1_i1:96-878(+)